jgi:hypothetical protein
MNLPRIGVVPPRRKYRPAVALFALLGALPSACVYDSSDRCGPNEVMYEDLRCVCDAFSAATATGCERCEADEVPGAMGCECKPGYTKPDAESACAPAPMGLGAACDATTACEDPEFNHCEAGADGKGYCTKTDCASPEDCSGGFACDAAVTPSVCRRPPLGLAMSCTSDADCAGTEATYCDTFQSHSCLVQGCSVTPDNCFTGWDCCDLSAFGVPQPICIPEGACTQ